MGVFMWRSVCVSEMCMHQVLRLWCSWALDKKWISCCKPSFMIAVMSSLLLQQRGLHPNLVCRFVMKGNACWREGVVCALSRVYKKVAFEHNL